MALVQNPKRCGAKSVLHHGAKPILHQDQIYGFWHRGRGFTTKPHPFGPKMVQNRGGNVNFLKIFDLGAKCKKTPCKKKHLSKVFFLSLNDHNF